MIKSQWKLLSDKTAALEMREKAIIFAGLLLLIGWVTIFYFVLPLMDSIEDSEKKIGTQMAQIQSTQKQIGLYQGALGKDPNTAVNESLAKTQSSIDEVDKLLAQLTVNFISPHKMREVLNELLKSDNNIKVTEFTALAAQKVNIDGVPANAKIIIYQHGIRLTVLGSYFDLQKYMKRVEELPWQFNWRVFDYTVEKHPLAKLEIEITTISTNERFIAI
jgi:MSHA biogenesis protein MshJ